MKKYIQITAGRGPVECARAVTLVAREMVKSIPNLGRSIIQLGKITIKSITASTTLMLPESLLLKKN